MKDNEGRAKRQRRFRARIVDLIQRGELEEAWIALDSVGSLLEKLEIASLRASIREIEGRVAAAAMILQKAAQEYPRKIRPRIELVELCRDTGKHKVARKMLKQLWEETRRGRFIGMRRLLFEELAEVQAARPGTGAEKEEAIAACARALAEFPGSKDIQDWTRSLLARSDRPDRGSYTTRKGDKKVRRRRQVAGRRGP